jgi:hypothetical protein
MTIKDLQRRCDRIRISPTSCWSWRGGKTTGGYAIVRCPDRGVAYVHRQMYEALVGPIPKGLQIDHLCRVRHCVNPAHLEPVTNRENTRRGKRGVLKTHCNQGHPWIPANIMVRSNGKRECAECNRIRARKNYCPIKRRARYAVPLPGELRRAA